MCLTAVESGTVNKSFFYCTRILNTGVEKKYRNAFTTFVQIHL